MLDPFLQSGGITTLDALLLGVPVVTLLGARVPGRVAWILPWASRDWCWLLSRDDTPWYPAVRLFRQDLLHVREPVMERIAEALRSCERCEGLAMRKCTIPLSPIPGALATLTTGSRGPE